MTQSVENYQETSFTFQNKFQFFFGTLRNLKKKKLSELKEKVKQIGYFPIILDTHFIPLQNEPSPILVGPKLREPQAFECWNTSLFRRVVVT